MDWTQDLVALAQVVMIDVALAGDNAVVVGMAVAGLPSRQTAAGDPAGDRRRHRDPHRHGRGGAAAAGDHRAAAGRRAAAAVGLLADVSRTAAPAITRSPSGGGKTLRQAMMQIILADVSMSLDNVLAVAGAAHDRLWVLVTGLLLSVVLMGVAAGLIARLLERYRWIAWVGLLIVLYVALNMIWHGGHEVAGAI